MGIPPCSAVIRIATTATNICPGTPVAFTAMVINGGTAPIYQWKINGGNVGSNTSSFTTPLNNFDVVSCLLIPNNGCNTTPSFYSNNIQVSVRRLIPVNIGADRAICAGTSTVLAPSNRYLSYLWQDGSQQPGLVVTKAGNYYVQVQDSCGIISSDTVLIRLYPRTTGFLPADTAICSFETFVIKASRNFRHYLWSTNSVAPVLIVDAPGRYWLSATDSNGCAGSDTIVLKPRDFGKGIYIPNAFTPNGDFNNDIFRPRVSDLLLNYQLTIFDRWGRVVFKTNNIDKVWDGRNDSNTAGSSVFVWVCNYQLEGEPAQVKKGTVTLIR